MEKFDAHQVAEKIMEAIQKEYKELKTLIRTLDKVGRTILSSGVSIFLPLYIPPVIFIF